MERGWSEKAMTGYAHQSHKYSLIGCPLPVMAMESGRAVEVAEIDLDAPWPLTRRHRVHASMLEPMPMRYYYGEIPR